MESREVLARLAEEGIRVHRETLARISDDLGLKTRNGTGRNVPRRWTPEQVRALIGHLRQADLGACGPLPLHGLSDSGGPYPSREVLGYLDAHGFPMHRETLARISDQLRLATQEGPGRPREWTRQHVDTIHEFLVRRQEEEQRRRQEAERRLQQERERQRERERERALEHEERRRQRERQAVETVAKSILLDTALDLDEDQLHALLAGNPDLTRQFLDQVTGLLQGLVSTIAGPDEPSKARRSEEAA